MLAAFTQLNWFAVTAAAVTVFLLGAAWFTPLFGTTWHRSLGRTRAAAPKFGPGSLLVPRLIRTEISRDTPQNVPFKRRKAAGGRETPVQRLPPRCR